MQEPSDTEPEPGPEPGSEVGPEVGTEPGPVPDPAPAPVDDVRRYPSTIGGACYLAILGVVLAGLVIAGVGSWRFGIQVVAGALMAASVLRLALRQRDAGMLAVRHRLVDAAMLSGAAAALFFLAATIPDQPL